MGMKRWLPGLAALTVVALGSGLQTPAQSRGARRRLQAITDISGPIPENARVLDLGCGHGDTVRELRSLGYEAYGYDVYPTYGGVDYRRSSRAKDLYDRRILRYVTLEDYRAPFDDDFFDIVISDEVFEHVADYPGVLRELHRVMRPGGRSLHLFPSRYRVIEPHCFVPFASVVQSYWWLKVWATLGIRNANQKGLDATQTALWNQRSLTTGTNYLTKGQIRKHVASVFGNCSFEELTALKHSGVGRFHPLIRVVPLSGAVISAMRSRALYFEKSLSTVRAAAAAVPAVAS